MATTAAPDTVTPMFQHPPVLGWKEAANLQQVQFAVSETYPVWHACMLNINGRIYTEEAINKGQYQKEVFNNAWQRKNS